MVKSNSNIEIKNIEKPPVGPGDMLVKMRACGILGFYYSSDVIQFPAILLTFGILIFSGSLYLLVLTGTRWIGAITPLGGLAFIAGWIMLIVKIRAV